MRITHRLSLLALCLALTAWGSVSSRSVQAPSGESGEWVMPRTEDGHPDLQGNWTNATLTPFERPRTAGPVLTLEEVAEIEGGQAESVIEGAAPSDPARAPPPEGGTNPICIDGATSCYNEFYREPGERVAVVNGEPRSSLVTNPLDGRVPELTAEGRRRVDEHRSLTRGFGPYDHPELRPLGERCILSFGSNAGPPMLPNYWYNNNYTIVQNADHVMILVEMVHDVRIIRLGERKPLPEGVRPWLGDSWGRWEGDTLVVETLDIHPDQAFRSVPPNENTRIVERFSRVDEDTILYEFSVEDPAYTQVWGGQVPFERLDGQLYEYACHEANYSLANVLSGARYQESLEQGR